jgi:F-type H+-transporting ATPase subunit delta
LSCSSLPLTKTTAQADKYNQLTNLNTIMDNYFEMWVQSSSRIVADITTAHELNAAQEESLRKQLLMLGVLDSSQEVIFKKTVDPEMLGGIRAKVGNNAIDLSLASKIDRLESQMLAQVDSYFDDRLNSLLQ